MIISHEARALFVHVQKTGGLTVEAFLLASLPGATRPPGERHVPLRRIHRARPEVRDYWTFGFVRNPWARMWSWWSMIQRRGEVALHSEQIAGNVAESRFWTRVLEYPDFETFVTTGPEEFGRLRRAQVDYLRSPYGSASLIGRLETLDEDLRAICEHLGIAPPEQVERRNAGPSVSYREQFTPRGRDRVAELFEKDLTRFGYEF